MKYAKIIPYDTGNYVGINATIFLTGCTIGCKGCFNKEIQDFKSGREFGKDEQASFIQLAKDPKISHICILGGEPFDQDLYELYDFVAELKHEVGKPIVVWTGRKYYDIYNNRDKRVILRMVDILIDGPFMEELKDPNLIARGSSNQRIIDVQKSLDQTQLTFININW